MDAFLKQQIADALEVAVDDLAPKTVLRDFRYWDSVMALTIMAMIDTSIGKPVSSDDFTKIVTFGDLEALVDRTAAGIKA